MALHRAQWRRVGESGRHKLNISPRLLRTLTRVTALERVGWPGRGLEWASGGAGGLWAAARVLLAARVPALTARVLPLRAATPGSTLPSPVVPATLYSHALPQPAILARADIANNTGRPGSPSFLRSTTPDVELAVVAPRTSTLPEQ